MFFVTVSAFEKGRHDQVATTEQSKELLRQALANSLNTGLRGRGGSYNVMVLGANETFADEDLYEELDESKNDHSTHGNAERHAQAKRKTKHNDGLRDMMCHKPMPYHLSFLLPVILYSLVLRQGW